MNLKSTLLTAMLGLIMSTLTAQTAPVPTYTLIDLQMPGYASTVGNAVNASGDVVGYASDPSAEHAFLYTRGKFTDLGAGAAIDINASKEVIVISASGVPFLYKNGKVTTLPAGAYAINDSGQILIQDVGAVEIREHNGAIISHPIGNAAALFTAQAINNLGQVIGREFVPADLPPNEDFFNEVLMVQPGGSYRVIATNLQDNYCFPRAMNNLGQGVGYDLNLYFDTLYQDVLYNNGDAMLYNPNGTSVVLGNLFPGTTSEGRTSGSNANAINSFGVIVGSCQSVFDQTDVRGFVYFNGTMYDLNTLVNSSGAAFKITSANGINDAGQILASATDTSGNEHTVILSVTGAKDSDVLK